VGDPYSIEIPHSIDESIKEWEIPQSVRDGMYEKLKTDLAQSPADHLRQVNAPWNERLNMFCFTLPDPDDARSTYTFTFHLTYSEDERSLRVVDFGYQKTTKLS
jgi:hypothetical protein